MHRPIIIKPKQEGRKAPSNRPRLSIDGKSLEGVVQQFYAPFKAQPSSEAGPCPVPIRKTIPRPTTVPPSEGQQIGGKPHPRDPSWHYSRIVPKDRVAPHPDGEDTSYFIYSSLPPREKVGVVRVANPVRELKRERNFATLSMPENLPLSHPGAAIKTGPRIPAELTLRGRPIGPEVAAGSKKGRETVLHLIQLVNSLYPISSVLQSMSLRALWAAPSEDDAEWDSRVGLVTDVCTAIAEEPPLLTTFLRDVLRIMEGLDLVADVLWQMEAPLRKAVVRGLSSLLIQGDLSLVMPLQMIMAQKEKLKAFDMLDYIKQVEADTVEGPFMAAPFKTEEIREDRKENILLVALIYDRFGFDSRGSASIPVVEKLIDDLARGLFRGNVLLNDDQRLFYILHDLITAENTDNEEVDILKEVQNIMKSLRQQGQTQHFIRDIVQSNPGTKQSIEKSLEPGGLGMTLGPYMILTLLRDDYEKRPHCAKHTHDMAKYKFSVTLRRLTNIPAEDKELWTRIIDRSFDTKRIDDTKCMDAKISSFLKSRSYHQNDVPTELPPTLP